MNTMKRIFSEESLTCVPKSRAYKKALAALSEASQDISAGSCRRKYQNGNGTASRQSFLMDGALLYKEGIRLQAIKKTSPKIGLIF